MSRQTDNERLLEDVLAPEADSGFSAEVLAATLRGVRRRRRVRQVRNFGGGALVVLAVLAVAASLVLRRNPAPELAQTPGPANYRLVMTQPLAAEQVVRSQPLAREQFAVATAPVPAIPTVGDGYREIGDDELLALAAPQVVALVRREPDFAELVFLPPAHEPGAEPN
jgi:hypothetical protein